MPTVSFDSDSYQDLDRVRERIDYSPSDFFDDNPALRFDELLVELERESRGIFETLWGDETPLNENNREDIIRATDDSAIPLVYPVTNIDKVEYKTSQGADWEELDTDRYDNTEHRLILARRPNLNTLRRQQLGNTLDRNATRGTWRDLAVKLRVTYDRGFGNDAPPDVKSIQIQLIENMLRDRKARQTESAASAEELNQSMETTSIVTEEIRNRISDVTSPGYATMSI